MINDNSTQMMTMTTLGNLFAWSSAIYSHGRPQALKPGSHAIQKHNLLEPALDLLEDVVALMEEARGALGGPH